MTAPEIRISPPRGRPWGREICFYRALTWVFSVGKVRRPVGPRKKVTAEVAELVDALDSGSSGETRGGSSPLLGTIDDLS